MRKITVGLVAALLLVGVAGCSEPTPERTPVPTASATPVFASDEEALAAAEEAYGAYLAELDRALSTLETAGLEAVATDRALSEAIESVDGFKSDGHVLVGASSYDSASLIQAGIAGDVDIYACWDISETDVVDESGVSTVLKSRPSIFPMQISLDWLESGSRLIVREAEVWDGESFCAK